MDTASIRRIAVREADRRVEFGVQKFNGEIALVEGKDFFCRCHVVRHAIHIVKIFDRHQERHTVGWQNGVQVGDVGRAQIFGQRRERGAVIHGTDFLQIVARQGKKITAINLQTIVRPGGERAMWSASGVSLCGRKEMAHRDGAEFDAQQMVTPVVQPHDVEALATQREKDTLIPFQSERRPKLNQKRMDMCEMKRNVVFAPTLFPERMVRVSHLQALSKRQKPTSRQKRRAETLQDRGKRLRAPTMRDYESKRNGEARIDVVAKTFGKCQHPVLSGAEQFLTIEGKT